jgi:hypothetical protein
LSFRYDARQASLVDLTTEKHPAHYDLCVAHADLLIVPRGWERLDRRTPRPDPQPRAQPHRQPDIGTFVRALDEPVHRRPRMDRYAALIADLPRLARACGLAGGDGSDDAATNLYEPVTGAVMTEEQVLEGQLQMAMEPEPDGVVVALTRTRQN